MKQADQKRLAVIGEAVEGQKTALEAIRDEMQDAFDEKSEKWQEGDLGEKMREEIDAIGLLIDNLDTVHCELSSFKAA